MMSVKQDTVRGVKWSFFEKIAVQGIQFVLGIIMARLLSPSDYGIVAMYGIFFAVSQTFIDSGFSSALIQKQNRTEEDFCTVFYFNITISCLFYALLFLTSPWIADFFHEKLICPIIRVQAISLIINALMAVQVTKLTIDVNFKAISIRSIISSIGSGIIGVTLAYLGFGVWAIVYQGLTGCLINAIFIALYCRWIPKKHFSIESFRSLFAYGSKLLASGLINTIYSNLTTLIIGKFFTSKDLGVYNRGQSIPGLYVNNFNGAIQRVMFPILSKFQNDDEKLIHYYREYIITVSVISFFVCSLIAAVGKPLVLFLLTSKWEECIIYLQLSAFSLMFDHLNIINHTLLLAKGRSDLFLKLELIKKPIFLIFLFSSIPFGVIGICVSSIINSQIAIVINTYYTGKIFDYGYLKQIKDYLPVLFSSILACLPAYLLTYANIYPLLSLIIGCLASIMLYYLFMRKNIYFKNLISLANERLQTFKVQRH